MSSIIDASRLIGKHVKDESNREIGKIVSFLIDTLGRVEEVLVENKYGKFIKYPVDRLKANKDDISLSSYVDKRVEHLAEKFPVIKKKRQVLEKLSESKVIPSEIYENLCKEFDKALTEMTTEAQNLLEDLDKQVKAQEEFIKILQVARTFLEIEYGIGNVKDEVYQASLLSILKETKNTSQKKLSLLKNKDRVSSILLGQEEELKPAPIAEPIAASQAVPIAEPQPAVVESKTEPSTEPTEEKEPVTVRMTQE